MTLIGKADHVCDINKRHASPQQRHSKFDAELGTLHLIWVWASMFAVFYLVSTLKVYEAALALGLFITNTITIWDQPVSADLRLRQTLFTLLAILIGCAASVLVEHLLSRTHPADAVIEGIEERLTLTGRVLQCVINNAPERFKVFHEVRRRSAQGTAILRSFVAQAGYSFEEQQRLSTAVALAGRLIDLAASIVETRETLSSTDLDLCTAISKNLSGLSGNLLRKETPGMDRC
jgi:multidrug resistance protein MdtO